MQTIADLTKSEQHFANDAGFVQLDNLGMIMTSGADCKKHLNSFCTNEILKAGDGDIVEAFILDVKGKTIAHVFCLIHEESVVMLALNGQNQTIVNHLDRYVIREDVEFEDQSADNAYLWLDGPNAGAFMLQHTTAAMVPADNAHLSTTVNDIEVIVAKVCLFSETGFLLVCANNDADQVISALTSANMTQCDAHALELLRIKSGVPAFGNEVTADRLPQELCRDAKAISFVKGCYLGQETVARIDALGQVNWLLAKLACEGQVDDMPGTLFMVDEKQVGKITSVAWSPADNKTYALGMLRRGNQQSGNTLDSGKFQWTVIE